MNEYNGLCEAAAAASYKADPFNTAKAHWQAMVSQGLAHPGDLNPPKGALVFWNSSIYYHVGVATGTARGFWATGFPNGIGTSTLPHFSNYLGWSPAVFE